MRTLCTVTEGGSGASIVGRIGEHPAASVAAASTVTAKVPRARSIKTPVAPAKERNITANLPVAVTFGIATRTPTDRTCPLHVSQKLNPLPEVAFHSADYAGESHLFADSNIPAADSTPLTIAASVADNRSGIMATNLPFCAISVGSS
jgi:hypothetical protein